MSRLSQFPEAKVYIESKKDPALQHHIDNEKRFHNIKDDVFVVEKNESPAFKRRQFLETAGKLAVTSQILFGSSCANAEYSNGKEAQHFATPQNRNSDKPDTRKVIDIRYFIAGAGCASFSHGLATPFDVIKTKIQVDPDINKSGLLNAASAIVEEGGVSVLLSGLGPTVLGYGLEGAMKFGAYETLKPQFAALFNTADQSIPYLAASVSAGAIASLFLCPLERLRIKMVTDKQPNTSLFSGLNDLLEQDGILFPFNGFTAMLLKQVPYTATKQVSFEMIATSLYGVMSAFTLAPSTELKLLVSLTSAFLASMLACVASHPGDVIVTRAYSSVQDESVTDIASSIYQEEGVKGIFSGISARFWHVGAIVTSQLVFYDFLKQLLGLPATGA